jgi:hypothetical protein
MSHIFSQHDTSRIYDTLQQTQGVGTESSDSTLAEGRAALDEVTRKILTRTSGRGYTLAGCLPARKIFNSSLAKLETHLSLKTL